MNERIPYCSVQGSREAAHQRFAAFAIEQGLGRAVPARLAAIEQNCEAFCASVEERCAPVGQAMVAYCPSQFAEAAIVGKAVGMSPIALTCLSGLSDTSDFLEAAASAECTLLMRPGAPPTFWQTWDFPATMESFVCVVERKIDATLRNVCLTTIFGHAHFGINESGLAIGTQNLQGIRARLGIPFSSLIAQALERCTSIDDAIAFLTDAPRMSAHRYSVGDATGRLAVLEATSEAARRLDIHQVFAASNHPAVSDTTGCRDYSPGSRDRVNQILDMARTRELSSRFRVGPPVLRVNAQAGDAFRTTTIAFVSFDLARRSMTVARPDGPWSEFFSW